MEQIQLAAQNFAERAVLTGNTSWRWRAIWTCANDACSLLPEVSSESMLEMSLQKGCNFWWNNGPI